MQDRPDPARPRRKAVTIVAALLLLGAGAALLSPLLTYPLGRDQGVFACVADIISRGGVPYRDAWEMKPPGIFYLFRASFALFGRSMLAPRLLDLIWTLATAAAIYALGRRLLSSWAGLAGAVFLLVRYVAGHSFWNTTQCEGFASLPLALAALSLAGAEQKRSTKLALLSGVLVALAIMLKLTLGVFLALPCIALLVCPAEGIRGRALRAVGYLVGCLAALGIVVGLLAWAGALRDMYQVLFVWNTKYAALRAPGTSLMRELAAFMVGGRYLLLLPIGLLAVLGTGDLIARPEAGRMRWLLPAWALVMIAGVWLQGKYYTYHWLAVLPPLALLAGQGVCTIWFLLRRAAPRRAATAIYLVSLVALAGILAAAYWQSLKWPIRHLLGRMPAAEFMRGFENPRMGGFSLRANRSVADLIEERTSPRQHIYVWGFEPLIYHLADRPPASRFIYQVPLVTAWSPPEWRSELVSDLERGRPSHIIVGKGDMMPWMTGRADDSAAQLAGYPELARLLQERYAIIEDSDRFSVWELR